MNQVQEDLKEVLVHKELLGSMATLDYQAQKVSWVDQVKTACQGEKDIPVNLEIEDQLEEQVVREDR